MRAFFLLCFVIHLSACACSSEQALTCGDGTHPEGSLCVPDPTDAALSHPDGSVVDAEVDAAFRDAGLRTCASSVDPGISRPTYVASQGCVPQSIEELSDGAFAVLSSCGLTILDKDGSILSQATYGATGFALIIPIGAVELEDCSIAVVSQAIDASANARIHVARVTREGDIQSTRVYGVDAAPSTRPLQVRARRDGTGFGVLVSSWVSGRPGPAIVEFNDQAHLERATGLMLAEARDIVSAFAYQNDGGVLVLGSRSVPTGDIEYVDGWAAAIDPSGTTSWAELFAIGEAQKFFAIETTPTGFVALARHRDTTDTLVLIGHSDGTIERAWVLGGPSDDYPFSTASSGQQLDVTADGSFVFGVASRSFGTEANPAWLVVRANVAGDVVWSRALGGDSFGYPVAARMTAANDVVVLGGFDDTSAVTTTGFLRLSESGTSPDCASVREITMPTSMPVATETQILPAITRIELSVSDNVDVPVASTSRPWSVCPH